jgi:peptidoglycan/xylan/chitin deacetylase (PgdA/CDA1 family)
VLRVFRIGGPRFSTIVDEMRWIPWKVRLSCCALAMVGGSSFAGAAEVSPLSVAIAPVAIRPSSAPIVEPVHSEPGPDVPEVVPIVSEDVTGLRFPSGLTIHGGTKHRAILFTFDDGPSRRTTPRLLDLLDELGIKAVFFVKSESFGNGNPWEREHAEIVRDVVRRGHLVGNHTDTHRQLPLLRNAEIEAELAVSERKIEWTLGRTPRLIRPPGGALSKRVEGLLSYHGYTSVMWALYGGDLEVTTAEDVVRTFFRVLERREQETGDRGGIVLMHDTKTHSVDAVPRLVSALHKRNCKLLANGEELYDIVDDLGYFIPGHEPDQTLEERQEELRERTRLVCDTVALR